MRTTTFCLAFVMIGLLSPVAYAEDDDPGGGTEAARGLNDATRDSGKSYRRFLPTWGGGKAIEQQNKQNDKELNDNNNDDK
jgi:hypothetical protein